MKTLRAILPSALLLAACGGGGTGSVTGTINGQSFAVADVVSGSCDKLKATGPCPFGFLVLSTVGGTCSSLNSSAPSDGSRIVIQLTTYDAGNKIAVAPTAPGTYPIGDGASASSPNGAIAEIDAYTGGQCNSTGQMDGSVTITKIGDNDAYEGSADLTFANGDHVTVQFHASGGCDLMNAHVGC